MKCYFTFCLTILFFGCQSSQITFEVINRSGRILEDISIKTSDEKATSEIFDLETNESYSFLLDMKNVSKNDGHYMIDYMSEGNIHLEEFGYYTNGSPTVSKITISIFNDSLNYSFWADK